MKKATMTTERLTKNARNTAREVARQLANDPAREKHIAMIALKAKEAEREREAEKEAEKEAERKQRREAEKQRRADVFKMLLPMKKTAETVYHVEMANADKMVIMRARLASLNKIAKEGQEVREYFGFTAEFVEDRIADCEDVIEKIKSEKLVLTEAEKVLNKEYKSNQDYAISHWLTSYGVDPDQALIDEIITGLGGRGYLRKGAIKDKVNNGSIMTTGRSSVGRDALMIVADICHKVGVIDFEFSDTAILKYYGKY